MLVILRESIRLSLMKYRVYQRDLDGIESKDGETNCVAPA